MHRRLRNEYRMLQSSLFVYMGGFNQNTTDGFLHPNLLGYLIISHTYRLWLTHLKDELSVKAGGAKLWSLKN